MEQEVVREKSGKKQGIAAHAYFVFDHVFTDGIKKNYY